jgi:hypothetical protein
MKIGLLNFIKLKNLATFAISFDAQQNLTLGIGDFPARCFMVKISWTLSTNILRTIQDDPAGFFPFPKI